MSRSLEDARRWTEQGTAVFAAAAALDEDVAGQPSGLPGWSRKHVLAHVAGNADALGNLVRWAATGQPTPMYASPGERSAAIEQGSRVGIGELTDWLHRSASALQKGIDGLASHQWEAAVVTAQGRTVPATEVPWLRAREVWVHTVDLATGLTFADLPWDFLTALCDDIAQKRSAGNGPALFLIVADGTGRWTLPGSGPAETVVGPLAEVAAYLAGRAHRLTLADGRAAPALPAWL